MKRIILTSLFFCLAITTVLAQITLDGNTTTDTTVLSSGNINIDIAAPDSNGLSNNTYSEFSATSTIYFNNDTSNPNFTDGDRASIIVNQVTSNSPSILEGRIQVSGHPAKIIIANPNGITCNGCIFFEVTGVDLVTGTYDIATGTYDIISDNDITLGSGGLTGTNLNIQTNDLNISGSGGVTTDTLNLNLAGNFNNSGAILAYVGINITATDFNNSGTITIDNPFIAVDGINITATDFNNSGTITVNGDLNATVDSFINESGATINATTDGCNIVYTTSYTDNGTSNCQNFVAATIVFNIVAPVDGLSDNQVVSFDVNSYGTILNNSASDGTAQLGGIVTANPNITAGSEADLILFQVTGSTGSDLEGTIEVFGTEAGLIIANPNGITCNACGFINANRVDLVTGSGYDADTNTFSTIAAADIDITSSGLDAASVGILNIHAGGFTNTGVLKANTFNLNVAGNFASSGTITTESLNITADYTAINQGSIASNILDITANDFFRNLTGGDISVDSLNITAGGKVTNTANINVAGTLSITANNDSTRTDDPAGAFFYVSNRGNITADNFVITAVDNFYNRGNITTTSGFNTGARNIFFFNEEIDSFTGTYDGGTITLGGDSSFIADGAIENYGNIDLTGSNNLDITANSFTNHAYANVTADTLNLTVNSFINDGSIDAIIIGDTNNQ